MTATDMEMNSNDRDFYLRAIYSALEKGMAAKEVVCSITTGFRSIPSLRTAPGLNPYHASVADIGYGFDAAKEPFIVFLVESGFLLQKRCWCLTLIPYGLVKNN